MSIQQHIRDLALRREQVKEDQHTQDDCFYSIFDA